MSNPVSLIDSALMVQNDLQMVRYSLSDVDQLLGTDDLVKGIAHCQNQYFAVLTLSRTSANKLRAAIEGFVEDIVPLVKSNEGTLEEVKDEVAAVADQIAEEANESTPAVDSGFGDVKTSIQKLQSMLRHAKDTLEKEAEEPLRELKLAIAEQTESSHTRQSLVSRGLETGKKLFGVSHEEEGNKKVATNTSDEVTEHATKPTTEKKAGAAPTKSKLEWVDGIMKKWSIIETFFKEDSQREADEKTRQTKIAELVVLKRDVEQKLSAIDAAIKQATETTESLVKLEGKLGHFEGIWSKITKDLNKLREYLNKPEGLSREKLSLLVTEQAKSYETIMNDLQIYSLKVQVPAGAT